MHIGMIGLGKMGMNMTRRLLNGGEEKGSGVGHKVSVFARGKEAVTEAEGYGAIGTASVKELATSLPSPKIIWLMVPAGRVVDDLINELKGYLSKGDIIIDGGNTFYKDDLRRFKELEKLGIRYLDIGTSGGIWGLSVGYCLMIGGAKEDFEALRPVLKTLAPPNGFMYCGPSGAGHYVKMVHNGIEYGLMEAYAEGFELLDASRYGKGIDMSKLSNLWNQGSVVRSWLLELMEDAFKKDISGVRGYVEDSGEGRWTVTEGVDLRIPLPAITASLHRRFRSRQSDSFGEKVLAALRGEFGGHGVKNLDGDDN
ncbi:MAG: decarboxylating 6-phosphogluconate dehydrogenase [Deltaproteobacteria bacterium]|nr:decarboxylating 6-phosphogluconate dehydrogenase [Deltaproteobacteria bacterium]